MVRQEERNEPHEAEAVGDAKYGKLNMEGVRVAAGQDWNNVRQTQKKGNE